ncbi:ubiquinol-cytochrome C reductase complex subunit QCR10 [Metarhizium robertsii]|uniref:Ubiquinol-cytochrome C reductase complex subunit QCR10 n=1 Tax=Metarhizium robertsii TaxID=568076 RepID=A0A0A1UPR1_9HYPO|nr:ubiquinol-cytochrome C reductase complex subunit QCR10 [Metarhizium robertsii]
MVYTTPVRAAEFKSAYGPKYKFQPNINGWNQTSLLRTGVRSASFGGAAVVGLLLYVSGIPRVQRDVLQKIPFVGRYFIQPEVHPQDNVSLKYSNWSHNVMVNEFAALLKCIGGTWIVDYQSPVDDKGSSLCIRYSK